MITNSQNIGLIIIMRKYFTAFMAIALVAVLFYIVKRNYTGYNALVSIHNARWQKVHVQVRIDDNSRKLVFDEYLYKGQSKAFTKSEGNDIVYRRDLDPDRPDGVHFTNWTPANCGDSSACTINNL
ncbi:MAG TPA: hypothetical protein VG367_15845 [Mucilaginibacter sp.]|jgi:hypothetical protein|nr:hypothetical protein [Mucilaginibacter sp.]